MATMYKVINENILPPSHRNNAIDQDLDRIVLTALSRSIEDRYKDAQELKADLVLYSKGIVVTLIQERWQQIVVNLL